MASSYAVKRKLSGSTDGRGIKVAATSSTGTTIHTARSDTGDGQWDEVWLYAYNGHTSAVTLTIQFGGTSSPDDDIKVSLASQSGLTMIVPGFLLHNSLVVKAYATEANKVIIHGWVNKIDEA